MIEYYGPQKDEPIIAIVRNFYTEDELKLIWRELDFLTDKRKLLDPSITESAKDVDNSLKKRNKAIFLDRTYKDRNVSDILRINRKIFSKNIIDCLVDQNKIFNYLTLSDMDHTLISYYEDGDYYLSHPDDSIFTILTYFIKDKTMVSGGNLYLSDFDVEIEIENNMVIIIPGCYNHEVKTVTCVKNDYSTYGRYCMAQFINYKEQKGVMK